MSATRLLFALLAFLGGHSLAADSLPQRMFLTPAPEKSGYLWDVWLTIHEGKYYLYHLAGKEGGPGRALDNISLATSDDGVSWAEHGTVVPLSPESRMMGSCGVWRSRGEGLPNFIMNLSEGRGTAAEYNMPALGSDDLIHNGNPGCIDPLQAWN